MSKKRKPGRRIFLSPDPSRTAYAAWSANKWDGYTEVVLEISDCMHRVTLQLSVDNSDKMVRIIALRRLRRLQGILDEARAYLEQV